MPIDVLFRLTFRHGGHAHVKGPEWSKMLLFWPFWSILVVLLQPLEGITSASRREKSVVTFPRYPGSNGLKRNHMVHILVLAKLS